MDIPEVNEFTVCPLPGNVATVEEQHFLALHADVLDRLANLNSLALPG